MTERSHSDICKNCGGYCCTLSGTVATKTEVDQIIKAGHPNKFIEITENCYITDFGEDLTCPYLRNSSCEIYPVRPLLCKKYPIFSTDGEEHYLVHCPITQYLSNDDLTQCIEAALEVPEELFTSIQQFLAPFSSRIDERTRKFRMEPIELK
ncbi:MAG: YkgJ family cysteine cluster protein [Candidatus Thorarchaeota archaeon]